MSRVWRMPARLIVFLLVLASSSAWALEVPPLTGRIVDLAHILSTNDVAQLSTQLQAHEDKTGNQVAVLILPSLEGEALEPYSHQVATGWKLGQKGTDNGVLLLVALKERKLRIEVGYGLEGALTDLRSAHIIRNEIVPRFKAGDMPGGVRAGVDAILKTIEGTYQASERPSKAAAGDVIGQAVIAAIIGLMGGLVLTNVHRAIGPIAGAGLTTLLAPWLVPALVSGGLILFLLTLMSAAGVGGGRRRRGGDDWVWYSSRGGGWGGGSFDSGGFSGGGGDFGGGGASGNW